MFLFKPKQKADEILPPPHPLGEDDEGIKKPELFDEIIKPKKSPEIPEVREFSSLIKELDRELGQKESSKVRKSLKRLKIEIRPKKQKIKHTKKAKTKQIKARKTKHFSAKEKTKAKQADIGLEENLGLGELDFELPEELEKPPAKDIEFPETLDEIELDFGKEQKAKPKEVLAAEEEIKSAIEKIKKQEKLSLFKRLFKRRKVEEKAKEMLPQLETDGVSAIKNSISKARDALMRFDLESARQSYREIMRIYNNLELEDKAKVYHEIKELYLERKSAETLKIS